MSMQQLMLGVGASKKTYLDDVFSTYLYKGSSSSSQNINNGLDLSGEGGMVWIKNRASTYGHQLFDTVRGVNKRLRGDLSNAEGTVSNTVTAFNSNGLTVGTSGEVSDNNTNHASWSFRKAPGFFDVISWSADSGNNTKTLNHNLGSVPGLIIFKKYDADWSWVTWHRDSGDNTGMYLNTNGAEFTNADMSVSNVTSTQFTVGGDHNGGSGNYIAYVFAGGESPAATARSVDFDGTGDNLNTTSSSSDFTMGTGDFTIECWVKRADASQKGIFQISSTSGGYQQSSYGNTLALASVANVAPGRWQIYGAGGYAQATPGHYTHEWTHMAYVRHNGVSKLYQNGTEIISQSDTTDYDGTYIVIGGYYSSGMEYNGNISNFRVVKGTAVYTSSFRPPTEPLSNISGTVLLCCNNSSVTGSTVTPVTLNSGGDPTASTDSPFDDPAGLVFGDSKEGIIKCGTYLGNGSSTGPEINLGFEPQWVLIKNTGSAESWVIYDSMRGIVSDSNDPGLYPDTNNSEYSDNIIDLTSTGFKLVSSNEDVNENNKKFIYVCIRRSDGYVGKPADAGTGVFAMDGSGSGTTAGPNFDSNFPVDFALFRDPTSTEDWRAGARLIGTKYLKTNNTDAEANLTNFMWDYNNGWMGDGLGSDYQGWGWKRHAGFDVVTYSGQTGSKTVPHSLNAVPEMMWVKNRTYDDANGWAVYHKGLNGGTNPEQYRMRLQATNAEDDYEWAWQDTAPTSTHFTLGTDRMVNQASYTYLALLFSSVDGISKVGSYVGVSGNGNATINLGFTPRLFICKRVDSAANWYIWDSIRGLGSSGTEKPFFLNSNVAEGSAYNYLDTTSSGVTLYGGIDSAFLGNDPSNHKYIYYAHA